VEISKVTAFP